VSRVGWLDCSSGVSGDMLLGALAGAGVPLELLAAPVAPLGVELVAEAVDRGGLVATRVHVRVPETPQPPRTLADVEALVPDSVAQQVFRRLAEAEGQVHGMAAEAVHFHEVGALDAIADVAGACAGFAHLGLDRLVVSPVALGGGSAATAHGVLPVPVPAVLELLREAGAPSYGGPADVELATPTGVAIATTLASDFGPMPGLTVTQVGVGAGGRDLEGRANVLRLVVGEAAEAGDARGGDGTGPDLETSTATVVECNVDDLDPRVWPGVLDRLLDAGAADAWLTPILMKKGRPAHTLHVLATADRLAGVRATIFAETSTLGVRETAVTKQALARSVTEVSVGGQRIRVKVGRLGGHVLTAQPEWEDVAAAAAALGRPARAVLADASAQARTQAQTGSQSDTAARPDA
jgi:uncharacterized protein (TIGR00299 family) protein